MSSLAYRAFINAPVQQPSVNAIIIPNGNIIPPTPPTPVPNIIINNTSSNMVEIFYDCYNGKLLPQGDLNYLDGNYDTENKNPIPDEFLKGGTYVLKRYCDNFNQMGVSVNKPSLQIVGSLYINMWVYPIYPLPFAMPMTLITKGNAGKWGEYSVIILPDRRVQFGMTVNNVPWTLVSTQIVPEKKYTLVSVIRESNKVSIYINGVRDTYRDYGIQPLPTDNPLLVGYGYNSIPFNGMIDYLYISTYEFAPLILASNFLKYPPVAYYFTFNSGLMTFNGYTGTTVPPATLYDAKFICNLLGMSSNGFSEMNGDYLYYYTDSGKLVSHPTANSYNKVSALVMSQTVFNQLRVETYVHHNMELLDFTLLNGNMYSFNGNVYYFIDGLLYSWNQVNQMYQLVTLSENDALFLLSAIPNCIGYNYSFGGFTFYETIKKSLQESENVVNKVVIRIQHFTLGNSSSLVDYSGQSNAGTYQFTNTVKYLCSGVQPDDEPVVTKSVKASMVEKALDNRIATTESGVGSGSGSAVPECCNLYIYNTITNGELEKFSNYFNKERPMLENYIPVIFEVGKEFNIVDFLIRNGVECGREIYLDMRKLVGPGMYQLSVISSSGIDIKLNGEKYKLNTFKPQHITFPVFTGGIKLRVKLNFTLPTQVCKLLLLEP